MSSVAAESGAAPVVSRPLLDRKPGRVTILVFAALLLLGVGYAASSLIADISGAPTQTLTLLPFLLLGVALLIALGFEFVNGFHDAANAVATVIYTHSPPPHLAVIYSGTLNFLGVLFSSGAVAFGIITLLPVELILQVGSSAGFAMVFALLIAAIIWHLGTWWLGLPASSSHTLIGSIIGVGVANALSTGATVRVASTGARPPRSATRCCCHRWSASSAPRCCCWCSRRWSRTMTSTRSRGAAPPRRGGSGGC